MLKHLFLTFIVLFFQSVSSALALEGLVKFPANGNATIFLEVAVTPEEKTKGLMNRPNLDNSRGMVFVFRPPSKVTFWMKDTLIPLDMIFVNNGKVVNLVKNAKPNQTNILYPSEKDVTEVIEVNSGFSDRFNIMIGDKVAFENIAQIDYSNKSKLMIVVR